MPSTVKKSGLQRVWDCKSCPATLTPLVSATVAPSYLVRDVAIEKIGRDRENMGEVASGRLEVEAGELEPLVDVYVGQQLYFRVLREM